MGTQQQEREARLRAKALARWEGEGGALPAPGEDPLDGVSLRLLARVGAALLEHWDALPASLQDQVRQRVQTLGGGPDRIRARDNLHRFLDLGE